MVKLIITGAAGRVGTAIIKCALEDADFQIVGLVESKTHPDIGKPSAIMAGKTDKPLLTEDNLEKVIEKEGDIGAFLCETVRSTDVQIPSAPYWEKVREICTRHEVLLNWIQ